VVVRRACIALVAVSTFAHAQPPPAEGDPPPAAPPAEPPSQEEEQPTTGTVEGTVESPELEAPLSSPTVTIVGTKTTTTTDEQGRFVFAGLKPGEHVLRIELTGFDTVDRKVNISAGGTLTIQVPLVTLEAPLLNETIVVVGSRTPPTNLESPVPIDVVTSEEIGRSGRTETGRILHTLAPSFISTPQTVADGSDHVDPAALRGLGPDQVLILVNGKRRHRSALMHVNGTFGRGTVGADLNAIATGSIKRIEILRDGAASQYGSDAIAGVINIVTKDVTDLLEVSSQTGITGSGDGAQLKASANYGFKIGDKGFINVTGEFLQREATSRSGTYTGSIFTDSGMTDEQTLDDANLTREDFDMKIGESRAIAGTGAYNLEVPFSNNATFYSFGDISHRRGKSAGFYRFPRQTSQTVPEFYPFGFLPEIQPVINDTAITAGLRRKGAWNVDASLTHGRSSFQFNIENTVNASLGTSSPTTFDAGTLSADETVADLDLLRKIETKVVHSLSLVFGSELRIENYQIQAGDEASYSLGGETFGTPPQPKLPGAQVFPGFQPSNEVDRTRESVGIYAGAESEITKRFLLDIGGRYESYSDFGQSLIGKVATRVKLPGGLLVRGAASTGFRAPSLQQLWFSNVSTLFLDVGGTLTPTQVLTSNNQSPVTKAFGIPLLKEERSFHASGGVTFHPNENLSLSADGYFIRLKDRIVLTSQFTNANDTVADILAPFPGVSQAQFFANAIDTDTSGVDVVGDYSVEAGDGTLTLTAGANYTRTKVKNINIPGSLRARFTGNLAQLETFYFGRLARNRIEDSVPHVKGTAGARYSIKGIQAVARANYYGKVQFKADNPMNDESFAAKVLFDVDLGYQFTKNIFFAIGADNLLNTFPDKQKKEANISSGRFIYSRNVSQFGQNGGFYYAKLQLTFF
jgi:iron complex outermembrane recepter protein